MAWQQGDDLWGALDNRLLKGIEYTAKYNLGYDVPFETWTDCTGLYNDWTEPGAMRRGVIQNIYDQPYNHYAGRKGLKMPYTKKLLALQKKAEKQNKVQKGLESNTFQVPGVEEGQKLHQVFTYPAPKGAPLKQDYDVFICPRGSKEWTKIDTYMAKANSPLPTSEKRKGTGHRVSEISYCFFDFTGDVFVKVISKNRKFKTARIRPDYRGTIANIQNDSTVQFLLFQPENVSVELDGDITNNLLVFTSKPPVTKEEAEAQAKEEGRQFIYIPPGFYDLEALLSQVPLLARGSGNREGGEASSGGDFLKNGTMKEIDNPLYMPDPSTIDHVEEPMIKAQIISPATYMGNIMNLVLDKRGVCLRTETVDKLHVMITARMPLHEIVLDFYDKLKTCTRGYGSMDYDPDGYETAPTVKLEILVNGEPVDAFASICHADRAVARARMICERLSEAIPPQMFKIAIQGAIGGKIIAREDVRQLRKNVLAKCYGGDITRKRKLLDKQREGKKRMKEIGNVNIPQEAFVAVLRSNDEN